MASAWALWLLNVLALAWGLLVRPGTLPAARWVSLYSSVIGYTAMTSIGLLLLVTPTGSPPPPRWLARVMVATPVLLVVVATLTQGPLDPRYQALGGPFDLRGHGGFLLAANQVALAVTTLAVAALSSRPAATCSRRKPPDTRERACSAATRWAALAATCCSVR